jgi:hypothetical protein
MALGSYFLAFLTCAAYARAVAYQRRGKQLSGMQASGYRDGCRQLLQNGLSLRCRPPVGDAS